MVGAMLCFQAASMVVQKKLKQPTNIALSRWEKGQSKAVLMGQVHQLTIAKSDKVEGNA
jgi:hypothetical protein